MKENNKGRRTAKAVVFCFLILVAIILLFIAKWEKESGWEFTKNYNKEEVTLLFEKEAK